MSKCSSPQKVEGFVYFSKRRMSGPKTLRVNARITSLLQPKSKVVKDEFPSIAPESKDVSLTIQYLTLLVGIQENS